MPAWDGKTRQINVRVGAEQWAALEAVVLLEQTSRARLLTEALSDFLARYRERPDFQEALQRVEREFGEKFPRPELLFPEELDQDV